MGALWSPEDAMHPRGLEPTFSSNSHKPGEWTRPSKMTTQGSWHGGPEGVLDYTEGGRRGPLCSPRPSPSCFLKLPSRLLPQGPHRGRRERAAGLEAWCSPEVGVGWQR